MKKLLTLLLAVLLLAGCAGNKSGTFEAGKNTFLLNGKPFVVKAAEVHYPKSRKKRCIHCPHFVRTSAAHSNLRWVSPPYY